MKKRKEVDEFETSLNELIDGVNGRGMRWASRGLIDLLVDPNL